MLADMFAKVLRPQKVQRCDDEHDITQKLTEELDKIMQRTERENVHEMKHRLTNYIWPKQAKSCTNLRNERGKYEVSKWRMSKTRKKPCKHARWKTGLWS